MKRIAFVVVMTLLTFAASARSIHYFTFSQASRTVAHLNAQQELMIYCGHEYEIETYVLINEVWMERVNSAYYEIWVYGYDAYTGDEICMPLDLQCVWLYSGNRLYNAAQYLRFHVSVNRPTFAWHIPPYSPYVRVVHGPSFARTYHYEIHRYGWRPPTYVYSVAHPVPPLPYYYLRAPQTPAPMPVATWTPGREQPRINTSNSPGQTRNNPNVTTSTTVRTAPATGTGTRATGTGTATSTGTNTRATGTSTGTNTRATGTPTGTSTRATGSTNTRSGVTTNRTTATNSRNGATSTSSSTSEPRTRATSTTPTRATTSSRSSAAATPSSSNTTTAPATRTSTTRSTSNASGNNTRTSTATRSTSTGNTRATGSTRNSR